MAGSVESAMATEAKIHLSTSSGSVECSLKRKEGRVSEGAGGTSLTL